MKTTPKILIALFVVLLIVALVEAAHSSPVTPFIEHVTHKGHPTKDRPKERALMLRWRHFAHVAADNYNIDPLIVIIVIWAETRGVLNVDGNIGERGLMQCHGVAADGCDLSTPRGQIDCGARWLRAKLDQCGGDVLGALTAYQRKGGTCGPTVSGSRRRYRWYERFKQ